MCHCNSIAYDFSSRLRFRLSEGSDIAATESWYAPSALSSLDKATHGSMVSGVRGVEVEMGGEGGKGAAYRGDMTPLALCFRFFTRLMAANHVITTAPAPARKAVCVRVRE